MKPTASPIATATFQIQAAAVLFSFRRLQFVLKANFNPDQPRIPPGQSGGGRWTDTGSTSRNRVASSAPVQLIADTRQPYFVDLQKEEGRFGAHTIRRHVGRRTDELLVEMGPTAQWWEVGKFVVRRNGTFPSPGDANYYVNDIINENTDTINAYMASNVPDGLFLSKRYGYKTGIEWYRYDPYSEPVLRNTYGVGVSIEKEPRHRLGFIVHTAYPRNDDEDGFKMANSVAINLTFRSFVRNLHAEADLYKTTADIANMGLSGVPFNQLENLVAFFDDVLSKNYSDRQLSELWARSPAEIFVTGSAVTEVFRIARNLALKRLNSGA